MYDEIGQQLTGLKMQLELGTPEAIDRALATSEEFMSRVRYLSMDLPAVGGELTFVFVTRRWNGGIGGDPSATSTLEAC